MILKPVNYLRFKRWYYIGRYKIKKKIKKASRSGKIKVNLGSNNILYEGWINTDLPHFDISKRSDWEYFFADCQADNLLAEHVIEHIAEEKVIDIFTSALTYLKPGGVFRIAVPDGFNPDAEYIENVKPEGIHPEWGHKVLWTYLKIKEKIPEGFNMVIQEYYDEDGKFHTNRFSSENGYIQRCEINHSQNKATDRSLIVDLIKE